MADLTHRVIEVDRRAAQIVSSAESEAAEIVSRAERRSEEIVSGAQRDAARKRHEKFSKLQRSLELLERQKLEELEAWKRRMASGFSDKKAAKEIADAILRRFASEMRMGL